MSAPRPPAFTPRLLLVLLLQTWIVVRLVLTAASVLIVVMMAHRPMSDDGRGLESDWARFLVALGFDALLALVLLLRPHIVVATILPPTAVPTGRIRGWVECGLAAGAMIHAVPLLATVTCDLLHPYAADDMLVDPGPARAPFLLAAAGLLLLPRLGRLVWPVRPARGASA